MCVKVYTDVTVPLMIIKLIYLYYKQQLTHTLYQFYPFKKKEK